MQVTVFTLFPDLIAGYLQHGILGRALQTGQIAVRTVNIRNFGIGKHQQVDDAPYGGGAGMLMMVEPIVRSLESVEQEQLGTKILLDPAGKPFDQDAALHLAEKSQFSLICGRYEGFDQRVHAYVDEEFSIGRFVLMGGELAALCIIETVVRLLPGVVGNPASLLEETHVCGLSEYPQYTKPRNFRGAAVPEVLLSGNHAEISGWRKQHQAKLK